MSGREGNNTRALYQDSNSEAGRWSGTFPRHRRQTRQTMRAEQIVAAQWCITFRTYVVGLGGYRPSPA